MAVDATKGLTTTDGIDLNEILYGTVLPIVDIYNAEELLDLRAMLCSDHDESYVKFDSSGHWKFQKLAEAEKPQSKKKVWGKYQKDTEKYGLDIGYTFDWLMSEIASSEEVVRLAKKAVARDRALITAVILDECLTDGGSTTPGGWYNGNFSANENMQTPPTYGQNTFLSSPSHYVASGSTSLTLATITAMKEHIKQHGYKGGIWGLCNADMVKKIEDLAAWTQTITSNPIIDRVAVDGFAGRMLGVDWKETEWMPDDYLMIVGTGGDDAGKPMRYIQKKNPSARGLILTPGSFDSRYPIIDADYLHWLEALVIARGAGVVYKLATAYSSPDLLTNVVDVTTR